MYFILREIKGMISELKKIKYLSRNWYFWTFLMLLFATFSCSSTQSMKQHSITQNPIGQLQKNIDQVLQDSALHQTRTGILIVSLETGETLFSKNQQILFHPASNMKLLTTATALKKLGPDYTFPTIVYLDSNSIENGIVQGNIYLKGYGNPDLTWDDLEKIVKAIKESNISDSICQSCGARIENLLDKVLFIIS